MERFGKPDILCDESSIGSDARAIFMPCSKVALRNIISKLKQSTNPAATNGIVDILKTYASNCLQLQKNGQTDEVKFVQPLFRDTVGGKLVTFMRNSSNVQLENEVQHRYVEVREGENSRLVIRGKTDHVLKVLGTTLGVATIEDKSLGRQLENIKFSQTPSVGVAQVVSQMKNELLLLSSIGENPEEYCGVLQNGWDWVFVFRTISIHGTCLWYYVRCPPLCTVQGGIDANNCKTVARFLEHVIVIADVIADNILSGALNAALVNDAIEDNVDHHSDKDEDDEEGDAEKEEESYQYATKAGGGKRQGGGGGGGGGKSHGGSGKTKGGGCCKSKGGSKRCAGNMAMGHTKCSDDGDKENKQFPLTVANLCRLGQHVGAR
jgi:hypothetical protein